MKSIMHKLSVLGLISLFAITFVFEKNRQGREPSKGYY